MLRIALARLLHAVADRIEPGKPAPQIQYVYVYSSPPTITTPPWQQPFYGNTYAN